MSDNNDEIKESEKKEENNQNNDNILIRTDSPNINDSEANKILDKEDHINESTSLKVETNTKKDKDNSDFFHDKDITEDSIIYFSNKLSAFNHNYKFILYISIILYIIDIFVWFKSISILRSFANIVIIIVIFISSLHQAFSFRHNFEFISKDLYNFTKNIMYIFGVIFIAYIINIIYIFYRQILDMLKKDYFYVDKRVENLFIISYCIINICVPSLHLFRIISIKKGIKDLSSAKGEIYESTKIEDVEVINSVINEI